jgi:hypothetical protein
MSLALLVASAKSAPAANMTKRPMASADGLSD